LPPAVCEECFSQAVYISGQQTIGTGSYRVVGHGGTVSVSNYEDYGTLRTVVNSCD